MKPAAKSASFLLHLYCTIDYAMSKPIIYQMLPRLWGNISGDRIPWGTIEENGCGTFSKIDAASLEYLRTMGFSHVWYTGIIKHATRCSTKGCSPSDPSWVKGEAGSPYSITDYFAVNPYLADNPDNAMEEFEDLVRRTHDAGLKVIIDFVPNHVARDYGKHSAQPVENGLDANGYPVLGADDDKTQHWTESNDFYYYPGQHLKLPVKGSYKEFPAKASGNCYSPEPGINDWFDTVKINYCDYHTGTWDKMREVIRFWASKGVDGFRCDMVELVPAEFLTWLISSIKEEYKDIIFIAEVYQKHQYANYIRKVGFDYLYDKSGLYDALKDIVRKNAEDSMAPTGEWQSTRRITGNWQFLGDLQPKMLNFLENHDEPRFGSPEICKDPNHCFAALYVSMFLNTAPFMLYFGEEVGERGIDEEGMSGLNNRTTIFDWWKINSVSKLYREIHGEKSLDDCSFKLLGKFRAALHIASTEDAVTKGVTYDLCYCNMNSAGFDRDRHFAFLRHYGDSTLLFVSNFSDKDAEIDLWIPEHAFNWLEMKKTTHLNPDEPLHVSVKAYDAVMIRLLPDPCQS